jgi:hypothetical protein
VGLNFKTVREPVERETCVLLLIKKYNKKRILLYCKKTASRIFPTGPLQGCMPIECVAFNLTRVG